jgi:class 3 adenylate cyclase
MAFDLETMGLTEIIRLRETLSEVLVRRFERNVALVFTDVVGSTPYFAEFGDEAGRGLMQRHYDVLADCLPRNEGRVVDTAGDGAFTVFPSVDQAATALAEAMLLIREQNAPRPIQHHLTIRAGIHWGPVLTDGVVVTGDAVNTCARVTSSSSGGEIRLTKAAFLVMSSTHRSRCTILAPTELKGLKGPVEMMQYKWSTQAEMPAWVMVKETGERIRLPQKPVITFGRLREHEGVIANDVVLVPKNPEHQAMISRWHFEMRQNLDGPSVTALSDQITEIDGTHVPRGQSAKVRVGTEIRLAGGVMTLVLQGEESDKPVQEASRRTMMWTPLKIDDPV